MNWCRTAISEFFEYETPHILHIKSYKVGVFNRLVQSLIVAYIIGYVIVYKKGYQEFSDINSSVTSKVKGVAYPNYTDDQFLVPYPEVYKRVWDVADYVIPPQENGAFFIATNIVITPNQTQGICPEDAVVNTAHCNVTNNTCIADQPVVNGNGIMTGKCILGMDNKTHVCEIRAWCPVEYNVLPLGNETALLDESKNFTVLIKNSIEFPLFKIRRRNIPNSSNSSYLETCHYAKNSDPGCPIFRLGDIVHEAGENYSRLAIQGGVIAIIINWECNLDFNPEKCNPTYQFSRLDDPYAKLAKGWNFRYASYYSDTRRTLYKAYGIRYVVLVQGRGGRFNVVPLMLNVGSGLALLGLATFICDIITLWVTKDRNYYKEKKYITVDAKNKDEEPDETNADQGSFDYQPIRRTPDS